MAPDSSLPRIVCEAVQLCHAMKDPAATLETVLSKGEFERLPRTGQPIMLDPVPWSAKLISVLAARSRKTLPPAPHCALNWAKFGTEAGQPQLGDVLCYVLEDGAYVVGLTLSRVCLTCVAALSSGLTSLAG